MARSNLSCATTAPRGTGSGRLGFSEALLALEIMTKSVLCVFNSNLPRTPWGILKFFCCSLVFWLIHNDHFAMFIPQRPKELLV